MGKKRASLAEKRVVVAAGHCCTYLWDARVFLISSPQHGHPCVAFYAFAELWRIEMRLQICTSSQTSPGYSHSFLRETGEKKSSGNKACGWPRDEWQRLSFSLSWGEGFGLSAEGFLVWNEASVLFRRVGFLLQRRALTITLRNCLAPWAPNVRTLEAKTPAWQWVWKPGLGRWGWAVIWVLAVPRLGELRFP